jgi:hypothetical protein
MMEMVTDSFHTTHAVDIDEGLGARQSYATFLLILRYTHPRPAEEYMAP